MCAFPFANDIPALVHVLLGFELSMIVQNPTQLFGSHPPNTLHREDNDAVMLSACV